MANKFTIEMDPMQVVQFIVNVLDPAIEATSKRLRELNPRNTAYVELCVKELGDYIHYREQMEQYLKEEDARFAADNEPLNIPS